MQAAMSTTTLKDVHPLPPMQTILTHAFQGVIVRFSSREIHLLQTQQNQIVKENYLDFSKMQLQLKRCGLSTDSFRIQLALGYLNHIVAIIRVGQIFFVASVDLHLIHIDFGNIFKFPIIEILAESDLSRLLSLQLIGFKFGLKCRQQEPSESVTEALLGFNDSRMKELHLLNITIGKSKTRIKSATLRQDIGPNLKITFLENIQKNDFIVSSDNKTVYHIHEVNHLQKLERWRDEVLSNFKAPVLIERASSCLLFASGDTQILVSVVQRDPNIHKFTVLAENTVTMDQTPNFLKVLAQNERQLTFTLYNKHKICLFVVDGQAKIIWSEIKPKEPIVRVQPSSKDQFIIFYQKTFEIVTTHSDLLSSRSNKESNNLEVSATNLTYSESSSAPKTTRNFYRFSRERDMMSISKGERKNMAKNAQIYRSSPSPSSSPDPSPKNEAKIGQSEKQLKKQVIIPVQQFQVQAQKKQQIPNNPQKQFKESFNRVDEAVIAEAKSQDESQDSFLESLDTKTPILEAKLSSTSSRKAKKQEQSKLSSVTPPKKQLSNASPNIVSFGIQDLKRENSRQPKEEQIMSFNPKNIKEFNLTPKQEKKQPTEAEEYSLPGDINRIISFGDKPAKVNLFKRVDAKQSQKKGSPSRPSQRQKSQRYFSMVNQLRWRMNSIKAFHQIKKEILNQEIQQLRSFYLIQSVAFDQEAGIIRQIQKQIQKCQLRYYNLQKKYSNEEYQMLKDRIERETLRFSLETQLLEMVVQRTKLRFCLAGWSNPSFSNLIKIKSKVPSLEIRLLERAKQIKFHVFNLQADLQQLEELSLEIKNTKSRVMTSKLQKEQLSLPLNSNLNQKIADGGSSVRGSTIKQRINRLEPVEIYFGSIDSKETITLEGFK